LEGKFITYCRASTQKQGKSGLGLEAQKTAVLDYLNGGGWKPTDRVYWGRIREPRWRVGTKSKGGGQMLCLLFFCTL